MMRIFLVKSWSWEGGHTDIVSEVIAYISFCLGTYWQAGFVCTNSESDLQGD